MKREKIFLIIILYVVLTVIVLFTLFPVFYTISGSFKTNSEIMAHPESILPIKPTLNNYTTAWKSTDFNIGLLLWNSTYYTLIIVASTILFSSMAGYSFARGYFKGQKLLLTLFSITMFINLGTITVYPFFKILNFLHLGKSLWGLIVVRIFSVGIVNIYLVRGYVNSLPKELDEAAQIDGCGFISIFFKIIAPLLLPIMATIGILSFQGSWNDYLMPTIFTISNPSQRTLIVAITALKSTGSAASAWNLMLAGSVIAILPVLVAYAVGNRYFISGLTSGALKG